MAWRKLWSSAAAAAAARALSPRILPHPWRHAQKLQATEERGVRAVDLPRTISWRSPYLPHTSSFTAPRLPQSLLLLTRGAKRSSTSGGRREAPSAANKRNRSGQQVRMNEQESGPKAASDFFVRWNIPWDGKRFVTTMAAVAVSGALPSLVVGAVGMGYLHTQRLMTFDELAVGLTGLLLLQGVVGTATLMLCLRRYVPLPRELFSFDWRNPFGVRRGWFLWGVVGTFCSIAAVFLVQNLLNGEIFPRQNVMLAVLPCLGHSGLATATVLAGVGIVGPVYEEILFRGFLLTSLTKWLPMNVAVLGSAGVFAVSHGSLTIFPALFAFGTVMGFAYAKSGNLLTPIMIHSLWNSSVVLGLIGLRHLGVDIQQLYGPCEAITAEGVDVTKVGAFATVRLKKRSPREG